MMTVSTLSLLLVVATTWTITECEKRRMKTLCTVCVGILTLALFVNRVEPVSAADLPTEGLIYNLDATDSSSIKYDGSKNITSWASSQGAATGFTIVPVSGRTIPTYSATGGGNRNLPSVVFSLSSILTQNLGGATTPKCVFIMENTTSVVEYGGIWGRGGNGDNGIRLSAPEPGSIALLLSCVVAFGIWRRRKPA